MNLILDTLLNELKHAARGIVDQAAIERGSRWIEQLEVESPFWHAILMSFLYKSPDEVFDALGAFYPDVLEFKKSQAAKDYINGLQKRLGCGER